MDLVVFGLVVSPFFKLYDVSIFLCLNCIIVVKARHKTHIAVGIANRHECLVGHVQVDSIMTYTVVIRCVDRIVVCQRHILVVERGLHGIGFVKAGVTGVGGEVFSSQLVVYLDVIWVEACSVSFVVGYSGLCFGSG